jgi:hypothetical protein
MIVPAFVLRVLKALDESSVTELEKLEPKKRTKEGTLFKQERGTG